MKTVKLCLTLFFTFIISAGLLQAQHENSVEGDFRALMDLYESTNGDNWYDRTGWTNITPQTMGDAVGIEVNSTGRVISIDMQKVTTTTIGSNSGQHNGNNLTGTLPETIGNLKKVTYFNVKQNKLTGIIPETIGNMESLVWLSLGGQRGDISLNRSYTNTADHRGQAGGKAFEETNTFSGELPKSIGNLKHLEVIEIRRQHLVGTLPAEWGRATSLRAIFLNNQKGERPLGGPLPPEWGTLINVEWLNLNNNSSGRDREDGFHGNYTGEVPAEWLENWTNIAYLGLYDNELTGPMPEFLNSRDKRNITLEGNNFTGGYPSGYFNGDNSNLAMLRIGHNNISGEMPQSVPSPRYPNSYPTYRLYVYRAQNTALTGPLPEWIQNISQMVQFEITNSNFTGPLPKTIAEQPNVRLYHVEANNFEGGLPDLTWKSPSLVTIYIHNNNLKGPIPDSWVSAVESSNRLWIIRMSNNELEGEIPAWLVDARDRNGGRTVERIYLNNNKFTFKDFLPNYEYIKDKILDPERFYYHPQKPFGQDESVEVPMGEEFSFDYSHRADPSDEMQWMKDGKPISGATGAVLSIENMDESDEGVYTLELSNSKMPNLGTLTSEPLRITIGDDDSGSGGVGDKGGSGPGGDTSGVFPQAPTQLTPGNGEEQVTLAPVISWSSVEAADYYILHLDRNNPGGMVVDVMVEDTTYALPEILGDDAPHYWRVRAVKDGEMGDWSEVHSFTTVDAGLPEMASPVSPENNSENNSLDLQFTWENVDADQYRFRLINKKSSELLITDIVDIPSYTPNQTLDEDTGYIWQVMSVKNGIEGAWSPRWEFSTGEYEFIVPVPSLVSPGDQTEYLSLTPTFVWEDIEADNYVITVMKNETSNAKVLSSIRDENIVLVENSSDPSYTSGLELEPGQVYYWRVKGVKNGQEGEWSELWEFRTSDSGTTVSTEPGENAVTTTLEQNYPNPFNPTTQIEFTLSGVQNVSLRVYDMAGRQVANLVDGVLQAGRHDVTFDASNLASGIYIYRFLSDTHQFTRKMTLVK